MIRPREFPGHAFTVRPPAEVKALIACRMHAHDSDYAVEAVLGDITLMPHQLDAVSRLRIVLAQHRGALLADDVGLGKTYVALATARGYERCHVIAPAGLMPMWRAAIARTGCTHVSVHSLQAFSLSDSLVPPPVVAARRELLVVDEAHHLRNAATARYRAIAGVAANRDVLLVSATPLHNRLTDLRCVLALFAGSRADLLTPDMLASLTIRRTTTTGANRPATRSHDPLSVPYDAATLSGLLALPAPLPAHDGAVAGALIRIGLLRAWCSSDAALSLALRRRLLRGEALRDALVSGRHPTSAELRAWLVGEHEVQLAFPELMATQQVASGPLLEVLAIHLAALGALLTHHEMTARGDAARAAHLRGVLRSHPAVPVVAFSQFAGTVRALYRALGDIAGVGALNASSGHIASGRISRAETLARFAPAAQGKPPPAEHQAIRLLLTTDMLAEGVNLQDAGVVVHLDLPWTDALLTQRIGRAVRVGSLHREVHVYSFAVAQAVDDALQLLARLERKASLTDEFAGRENHRAGIRHRVGVAAVTSVVHATLERWRMERTTWTASPGDHVVIGRVSTPSRSRMHDGAWLALVVADGHPRLVAFDGTTVGDGPWIVAAILSAVDGTFESPAADAQESHHTMHPVTQHLSDIVNALREWHTERVLRTQAGAPAGATTSSRVRIEAHIRDVVASAPAIRRPQVATLADAALRVTASSHGVAAEQALDAWYATRTNRHGVEWLGAWQDSALLTAAMHQASGSSVASGVLHPDE